MYAVSAGRQRGRGFTLVEIMIALVILSIMLAIGVPSMKSWLSASSAAAASEFYAEGFKLARGEAVKRNAVTRMVLSTNATSGQLDWQVDLCVPTPTVPCNDGSGSWSTTTAANTDVHAADFRSIKRVATSLPKTSQLTLTRTPSAALAVYFTPFGWIDTSVATPLTEIQLAPAAGNTDAFPTAKVVVTLAGVVTKCNPAAAAHDSRSCPP